MNIPERGGEKGEVVKLNIPEREVVKRERW